MLKRMRVVYLVFGIILVNSIGFAAITTVENKRYWMAQKYIMNNILSIGLVNSYQEDAIDVSYVYDNCLVAIASMAQFNYGLAKEILDTLCLEVTRTDVNNSSVFYEYYYYTDTSGSGSGPVYCGNSAWLLQTLNIYQKRRPARDSARYRNTQEELARFLVSLQDVDGGLVGLQGVTWKSTEHNLIAYVALGNYGRINNKPEYVNAAERIRDFLLSPAIWNTTDGRFNRGAYDYDPVTDAQALGVLVFGSSNNAALDFAEDTLRLTKSFIRLRRKPRACPWGIPLIIEGKP